MHAHLYAVTDSKSPRKQERISAYLLTVDGSTKGVFKHTVIDDCTRHRAILTAIGEGFERFTKPCEITIHADDRWVLNMLSNNLDTWAKAGFCTNKGEPIGNRSLWEAIWKKKTQIEQHGERINLEPGEHKYTRYMIDRAMIAERNGGNE